MKELTVQSSDAEIYARIDGNTDPKAPTVVFANSLGTDHTLWDPILPLMPEGLRLVRFDKRGHGRSSVPTPPYSMGALVSDAEAVCDAVEARDAVFVGLSVGGLIAQGLAVKRMDIVRAMVLSNTAAKIGHKQFWDDRIGMVQKAGMEPVADGILERWFGKDFRAGPSFGMWRDLLISTPPEGYVGVCAAIAGSDFFTTTASLRLPTLGIAGTEDGSTPPDLVRETVDLIPGSRFELIRRAGHLPCVEAPETYAGLLTGFFKEIGHV
ncbi:3-oxoadipate enol-lactonase [Flavimaricola marinus]|uniref:3-oxoadipate enol-lactonase 2 n=1 Tax=Flavimaricola marinus TaxID=1819565 RepID=A0A238LFP7_9RHOB|nr:3-oxoadipate enol-lactonase [Flavimaricola marinus]SMY08438.1 3-oxoadipate enol-lactonase 2 [Flavimaricola marinus]